MSAAAEENQNVRSIRSVRMHDGTWAMMQSRRGMVASTLINDMTEAGLQFARCYRCSEPVPVEYGDLTGKPLAEWVGEAGKTVTRQHKTGHHPVTVGREAPEASRPVPSAPGSAVFLEPGGSPAVAAVPDRKRRQW